MRFTAGPTKADAELVIDPDAVLARSAAGELFQPVAGRNAKVVEADCSIELPEFSEGHALNVGSDFPCRKAMKKPLGVLVSEASDHRLIITQRVINIQPI